MNIYTKFDAEWNIFRYKNDNILEVLQTHRVRHFLWSFQSPDVWKAYTKFQINQRKTVVELRYDITSSGQMKKITEVKLTHLPEVVWLKFKYKIARLFNIRPKLWMIQFIW